MTDEAPTAAEVEALIARLNETEAGCPGFADSVMTKAAAALAAQAQRIEELDGISYSGFYGKAAHDEMRRDLNFARRAAKSGLARAENAEAALRQAPPREPTEAMIRAGSAKYTRVRPWDDIETIWRAMYDAAPAAPRGETG